ncbi:MAG: hypothetical protein ATN35_10165 [Epulopiscium sp. Nele67-Bin004]|nr:MAG: hypothetical protein ATN35_10165 [Epulopiscium sp. Nele67-Bin004]
MVINNNLSAMTAHRYALIHDADQATAIERLSSGLKINSAADNAASLAISQSMRAQISSLNQASQNAQDGISLIQTADGALSEVSDILMTIRELAVQAQNDTYTDEQKAVMQAQADELLAEITSIATDTEFNTMNLLGAGAEDSSTGDTGTSGDAGTSTAAETAELSMSISVEELDSIFESSDPSENMTLYVGDTTLTTAMSNSSVTDEFEDTKYVIPMPEPPAEISSSEMLSDIAGYSDYALFEDEDYSEFVEMEEATEEYLAKYPVDEEVDPMDPVTQDASQYAVATINEDTQAAADDGIMAVDGGGTTEAETTERATTSFTFQVGANSGQSITLEINSMTATDLGLGDLDLTSSDALDKIDAAIDLVSAERANLGAVENRLEYRINTLNTASDNLQSAESGIRDADLASEMVDFVKSNILSQSAYAMIAQANQAPETILALLWA